MFEIPELKTERLVLRAMTFEDWPQYASFMASGRAQFMGGPFDTSASWGLFCHDVAQWQLFGHGALMLEDRETGETFGQVGINDGPLFKEKELGWMLFPSAEGKGYAGEAAMACRDWAFAALGLKTLVSYIDAANVRSAKLAQRIGARLDPDAPRNDPEDLVFRHPHPGGPLPRALTIGG